MGVDGQMLLTGTVRRRAPEDTWGAVAPLLPGFGITRVARLTGLDYIGLPVAAAIRPGALTLSVSQGKGATDLLAALSAVMEAIELWHVEQPKQPVMTAAAQEVELPYPLAALPVRTAHPGLDRVPVDWTVGFGVRTGRAVPVPLDLVRRPVGQPWRPDLFRATSTGLACGNDRDEALLHALYEVVERDVLYADEVSGGRRRRPIDPASVGDPYCRALIEQVRAAGVTLEVAYVGGAYGLPTCLAFLWSEDYPVTFAGAGCHGDPHIALSRAVTEAVQSRLTCIAGTRDDLVSNEEAFGAGPLRPVPATGLRPWSGVLGPGGAVSYGGFAEQVQVVAARIEEVTGHEPVCCDLSDPALPFAAVKVVCPGTRSRVRRSIPR